MEQKSESFLALCEYLDTLHRIRHAVAVFNYVSNTLYEVLPYPTYETDDIDIKTNLVYEHLKKQYYGGGMSVYGHY